GKGLEFDTVFLPGWEEGLFPHTRALDESGHAGLEEERRLAYVGITRARKQVRISFAANRRLFNQWVSAIPSRFIDELPPDHVEHLTSTGLYAGRGAGRAPGGRASPTPVSRRWERPSPTSAPGRVRDVRSMSMRANSRPRNEGARAPSASATGCSTRSSATAASWRSISTSSRSYSRRPESRRSSTVSSIRPEAA
ncbi:MAG: ATP-dependent helicase, partial [Proteobacteria bacterium]|nr:ATP-dependent helicase [Pseudomonadota bacterium]